MDTPTQAALTGILLELSSQLISTQSLDRLLETILEMLGRLIDFDTAGIHMVSGDYLVTRAAVGRSVTTLGQKNYRRDSDFIWQYVERERKPYLTRDLRQESWVPLAGFEYIRSFMGVPFSYREEILGVLTVDHNKPNQYSQQELDLVQVFANYAALAIQGMLSVMERERYITDLEVLQVVGSVTVSPSSTEKRIAEETLNSLRDAFGYDLLSIYRMQDQELRLIHQINYPEPLVQYRIPLNEGIAGLCARTKQSALIPNVKQRPEFIAAAPDIESELCVPILIGDEVYGIINVESTEAGKLGDNDRQLLTILAQKLSIAFQNLYHYEAAQRRFLTLSEIYSATLDIAANLDETDLLKAFLERFSRLMDVSWMTFLLYDRHTRQLTIRAVYPDTAPVSPGKVQDADQGLVGMAFRTGKSVFTDDYPNSPNRHPNWDYAQHPVGAMAACPLLVQDRCLGVFVAVRPPGERFVPEEMQIMEMLVSQIAAAIDNRNLFAEQQEYTQQLHRLNELTTSPIQADDMQATLADFARQIAAIFQADGCYINLWDEALQRPLPIAAHGAYSEEFPRLIFDSGQPNLTARALESGVPLTLADQRTEEWLPERIRAQFPVQAVLALPLIYEDQKLGSIVVAYERSHEFGPKDLYLGQQIARHVAASAAKIQALAQERAQRERAEVQLAFSYALMETEDLDSALKVLMDTISLFAVYDAGSVILLNPENPDVGHVMVVDGYNDPEAAQRREIIVGDLPLLDQLRQGRREVYIPDLREDQIWRPGNQPDPQEVRSILLLPLIHSGQSQIAGYLTLKSYRPNAFDQDARRDIALLCNQAATTIRNLRLFRETRHRLDQVTLLAEMSEELNRALDLDQVLRIVQDRFFSILEKSEHAPTKLTGAIIIRQPGTDILQIVSSHDIDPEFVQFFNSRPYYVHEGTFQLSIGLGQWVEIEEVAAWDEAHEATLPNGYDRLFNLPLKSGSEVIGALTANHLVKDVATRRLLSALAELAGSAIYKTQLLTQARSRAVELLTAYEQLHEVDRLRDEFIQSVTHDLKAPLSFIRGYTELMAEGVMGDINTEQLEALDIILDRTDAITRLVGDILKVRKEEGQSIQQEPLNLGEIGQNAVRSARVTASQASLSLNFEQAAQRTTVNGDSDRLAQVFENLISNAIKYTNPGGKILVRMEEMMNRLIVTVSDTGIGIPEEELDRIWDRYYRVKNVTETHAGSGLGLANVRRIIEAHGGVIRVKSGPEGSTFTFELPLIS